MVLCYTCKARLFGGSWKTNLFPAVARLTATALPLFILNKKYTLIYLLLFAVYGISRAWQDLSPSHMRLLRRNYDDRKLRHYSLIQAMNRSNQLNAAEVHRFQVDCLALIAGYVRDHRADLSAKEIYASLLVEDGETLVVVSRDREHRSGSIRGPKEGMLAWEAIRSSEPKVTGDVYADFPATRPGKPYNSILCIPVFCGKDVVGVVSIDSSRRYHFDGIFNDLVTSLSPYVALLAWTLVDSSGVTPKGRMASRRDQ